MLKYESITFYKIENENYETTVIEEIINHLEEDNAEIHFSYKIKKLLGNKRRLKQNELLWQLFMTLMHENIQLNS